MSSKISELKSHPNSTFNIVNLFMAFAPEGKTKYVELLNRLTNDMTESVDQESIDDLCDDYDLNPDIFNGIPSMHFYYFKAFLDFFYSRQDIINFKKFCEFNERGLIKKNDLSTYRTFEEINVEFHIAEEREKERNLENQIIKILEDDEWLVLKPLTYQSSLKYGNNTKWCTASKDLSSHFETYSKSGILIYVLNRKTGLKVASHKSLSSNELTFWNQTDKRVDSSETGLPYNIIEMIRDNMLETPVPNSSLSGLVKDNSIYNSDLVKPKTKAPTLIPRPRPMPSLDDMFESLIDDQTVNERRFNKVYKSITGSSF